MYGTHTAITIILIISSIYQLHKVQEEDRSMRSTSNGSPSFKFPSESETLGEANTIMPQVISLVVRESRKDSTKIARMISVRVR